MKILIIDSHNMIHRARYGFGKGEHNITFGFFRCLKSEIARHDADMVYIVSEGRPVHRYDIFPDYKGNRKREKDEDFSRQKKDIFEICKHLPVTFLRHPNFECDDVIAMIVEKLHSEDEVTICSSDSDFIQLLSSPNVKLWNPVKKAFIEPFPYDYCTWKALKGDGSDNIPGLKGVGEKTANKLASSTVVLNLYFSTRENQKKEFEKFYSIIQFADIKKDDPLLENFDYNFNERQLFDNFQERSFKSIIGKSWPSWKNLLENLDEQRRKTTVYRSN